MHSFSMENMVFVGLQETPKLNPCFVIEICKWTNKAYSEDSHTTCTRFHCPGRDIRLNKHSSHTYDRYHIIFHFFFEKLMDNIPKNCIIM